MSRSRTNPSSTISAWILSLALSITSWAAVASDACPGPVGEDHPFPPFHFFTNSVVEANDDLGTKSQYPYKNSSCIATAVPDSPTEVHWLAPSIHGWLQKESPTLAAHKLAVRNDAQQMDGCLVYGNQGDSILARLFVDVDQGNEINHEKKVGCRQADAEIAHAAAEANGPDEKLIDIAQSVTNYFPSATKYARETMLRLDGEVGVTAKDNGYTSYFRYKLNPTQGSKGDPRLITVTPAFVGPAATLVKDYSAQNPTTLKGDVKNEISFTVNEVKNPRLVYATYDFLDGERNIVGSVDVPVFVSRQKR
jgi:hypothetical protein